MSYIFIPIFLNTPRQETPAERAKRNREEAREKREQARIVANAASNDPKRVQRAVQAAQKRCDALSGTTTIGLAVTAVSIGLGYLGLMGMLHLPLFASTLRVAAQAIPSVAAVAIGIVGTAYGAVGSLVQCVETLKAKELLKRVQTLAQRPKADPKQAEPVAPQAKAKAKQLPQKGLSAAQVQGNVATRTIKPSSYNNPTRGVRPIRRPGPGCRM